MATRRRFVQTSAGMLLVSSAIADLATGCGGSTGGGDTGPTPVPTPTPQIVGGIMTLPLTDYPTLANADGSAIFQVSGHGSLIVAHLDAGTGASSYICLSAVCTHQGCIVGYVGATNSFACPCHGSTYSSSGANTGGPAPAPLHSYTTTFDGTNVTVDLNS